MLLVPTLCLAASGKKKVTPHPSGYVVVTDYVKADGKTDVSDALQKVIDEHPNRTLFFPDGVYLISKPLLTPADPRKSVALLLSNYAVIKAVDTWSHPEEAMIRLGGKDAFNSITINGSNYFLDGGVIDGSGVARGVSIDSGRETVIRNTSIKNVTMGIHIKHGANSGSSDSDISSVNITGNCRPDCVGVLIEGFDNTMTNMRIGGVHVGVHLKSAGNSLRNIHPLYYSKDSYETSIGFWDEGGNNWYQFCYSDEFATGFQTKGHRSLFRDCFAYWYSKRGTKHVVFRSTGKFESVLECMNAGMGKHNSTQENVILECAQEGGHGIISRLHISDPGVVTQKDYLKYVKD